MCGPDVWEKSFEFLLLGTRHFLPILATDVSFLHKFKEVAASNENNTENLGK